MKTFFFKIRLPAIPLGYAILFPFTYVASLALEAYYPITYRHCIVETKETIISFLFACVALEEVHSLSLETNVVCKSSCSASSEYRPSINPSGWDKEKNL